MYEVGDDGDATVYGEVMDTADGLILMPTVHCTVSGDAVLWGRY